MGIAFGRRTPAKHDPDHAPALALALLAGAGCKRREKEAAPSRPPPLPAAEVTRARAACDDLVARLCACAKAQPTRADLAEKCHMKAAKPEALALVLEAAADPKSSDDTVLRAQHEAQKIVGKCIEEIAALPTLGCQPQAAPPVPSEAPPAPPAAP
jgi:hypothetical protein